MGSAPDTIHYQITSVVFEETFHINDMEHVCSHNTFSEDGTEDDMDNELDDAWTMDPLKPTQQPDTSSSASNNMAEEKIYDFMDDQPKPVRTIPEEEEEGLAAINNQVEILQWHYWPGHLSFHKIRILSLLGILQRHLAKIKPP
eukprot:5927975-Ditylum_brightwellii.AAC.1